MTQRRAASGLGAPETLAQSVDEGAIAGGQPVHQAVNRLDDDAPLGQTGDGAERVETRFDLVRHADAQLRVVLDALSCSSPSRGATRTTAT